MIHNFNTSRNNWPKQSLAKVYFQQRFQPRSEAEQIEKYLPQGYCDISRATCPRKEVDIQLDVSEKPSQIWRWLHGSGFSADKPGRSSHCMHQNWSGNEDMTVCLTCHIDKTMDLQKGWNQDQGQHDGICCFRTAAILQTPWWEMWTSSSYCFAFSFLLSTKAEL